MPTTILLHQDSFIELRYSPTHDILHFNWPRFDEAEKIQIEHSLTKLGEALRYYVVKRILIDFSNLQWPSEDRTKEFSVDTGGKSRELQKIGWVTLSDPFKEEKARELCRTLFPDVHELQSFPEMASTVSWLIE